MSRRPQTIHRHSIARGADQDSSRTAFAFGDVVVPHARLLARLILAVALAAGAVTPAHAQITWTTYTTGSGLAGDDVFGVYAAGSTIYAATNGGGLSVSANGGATWTTYTTANGLGGNGALGVYADASNVYVATNGGIGIAAIPAPGAIALLGIAGAASGRRRRPA
jgi:hypothetical protein